MSTKKTILEWLHIDPEHMFDKHMGKAERAFKQSMYKGWNATYYDRIMMSAHKADNAFECAVRTGCEELADQILEHMKVNHPLSIDDIGQFFIGDVRISWNMKSEEDDFFVDGDDDIIEADISEQC